MSSDHHDRLIALETQIAFQQRTIDDLNAALLDALKSQRRLERVVGELSGKMDRLSWTSVRRSESGADPNQDLLDEKPPHY